MDTTTYRGTTLYGVDPGCDTSTLRGIPMGYDSFKQGWVFGASDWTKEEYHDAKWRYSESDNEWRLCKTKKVYIDKPRGRITLTGITPY